MHAVCQLKMPFLLLQIRFFEGTIGRQVTELLYSVVEHTVEWSAYSKSVCDLYKEFLWHPMYLKPLKVVS